MTEAAGGDRPEWCRMDFDPEELRPGGVVFLDFEECPGGYNQRAGDKHGGWNIVEGWGTEENVRPPEDDTNVPGDEWKSRQYLKLRHLKTGKRWGKWPDQFLPDIYNSRRSVCIRVEVFRE